MTRSAITIIVTALLLTGAAGRALVPGARSGPTALSSALRPSEESAPVADFALRDADGSVHSLAALSDRKAVVVVFLRTDCPLAKLYGPRLADMAHRFAPRGVAFLGIHSGGEDVAALAAYAAACGMPFPLLRDPDGAVAARLGATRTPEALVLDAGRVIRYRGRIDDQYGVGTRRPEPTRRDLEEALVEVLEGRPVSQPRVPAAGCLIGRRPAAPPHGEVTFSRQVSRIVQKRCVECHRPGQAAPFPLGTFRDVAGRAAMVREVVSGGRMPPWCADPRHGRFRNDPRLTDEEKGLLFRWIDDGCPEGDPSDLPGPSRFPEGWRIPTPDRVIPMSDRAFDVPAAGEVPYQYFTVDPGFKQDVYIRAAEVRPGDRAVVHHALVMIAPPGKGQAAWDSLGAMLDYAPGMPPTVLPEGTAIRVAAGSKFIFQLHYTPDGKPRTDRTSLGLVFAEVSQVRKCVRGGAVINTEIDVPPGAADHRVVAEQAVAEDSLLLMMSPHMHLRGKSFRFEAVHPDGRHEILLDVPHYDFHWQLRYEPTEPIRLARGTRLVCTAVYDNSAANPSNPDPKAAVGWGDRTSDEMLIGFFAVVPAD